MRILFILSTLLLLGVGNIAAANSPAIYSSPFNLMLGNGGLRFQQSDSSTPCDASTAGSIRNNAGSIEVCNGSAWSSAGGGAGFATTELDNLGTTAINADLLPGSNNTRDIGASGNQFNDVFTTNVKGTNALSLTANNGVLGLFTEAGNNIRLESDTGGAIQLFAGLGDAIVSLLGSSYRFFDTTGTNYIDHVVPAGTVDYTLTWPSAQGGASTLLSNNGSGTLSWLAASGFASSTLNNLGTTAINADFIVAKASTFNFYTTDPSSTVASQGIWLRTGNTDTANSGAAFYRSGFATNGNSGLVVSASGNITGTGNSGAYIAGSGTADAGNSGAVSLISGGSTGGTTGNITITSGVAQGVASDSGTSILTTGASNAAASGGVQVTTGDGATDSGGILLQSGEALGGNSGGVTLWTGAATGTRGKIQLVDGTEGTSGHCWRSSDTDGNGAWSACPSTTSLALSALTGASGTNSIDHAANAQTWTWNSLTSETAMTISSSSKTSGKLLALSNTNNAVGNTGNVFEVASTGANNVAVNMSSTAAGTASTVRGLIASLSASTAQGIAVEGTVSSTSTASRAAKFTQGGANAGTAVELAASSASYTGNVLLSSHAGTAGVAGLFQTTGTGVRDAIQLQNTVAAANNSATSILFSANRTTSGMTSLAQIGGMITDITDGAYKGVLTFSTGNNAAPAERMRIDHAGLVGIGTTAPTKALDVRYAAGGGHASVISVLNTSASAGTPGSGTMISIQSSGTVSMGYMGHTWNAGGNGTDYVIAARTAAPAIAERLRVTGTTHMDFTGTVPTVGTGASDCGTSPAIVGNDTVGRVTVGSSTNGGFCTITFATAWTNTPICMVNDETSAVMVRATNVSTTSFRITGVIVAGDALTYHCTGYL